MDRFKAAFGQLVKFLQDARAELRRVVWPTRRETTVYTVVVIVSVVVLAAAIWGIDSLFSLGLGAILR